MDVITYVPTEKWGQLDNDVSILQNCKGFRQVAYSRREWTPEAAAQVEVSANKGADGRGAGGADAESWPSESDVTVVRVRRLCCAARARRSVSMLNLTAAAPAPAALRRAAHEPPTGDGGAPLPASAKARLAKFLRLYFCPCCACLYEMEKGAEDEASFYLA